LGNHLGGGGGAELSDLAYGLGYWYEFGHHWNIAFIPFDDWPATPPENATYAEKLKDARWQEKRKRIYARCEGECEECGAAMPLQVHHCYYRYGRQPWQYPDGALLALCEQCHKSRADIELAWRLFLPALKCDELAILKELLGQLLYWHSRSSVFDFLTTLAKVPGWLQIQYPAYITTEEALDSYRTNAEYHELTRKLRKMLATQSHPEERGEERPRNVL
jgi:hypothetical protein